MRVSVVIPTYNRADFLREAIASALQQDYPNVELIVVDDGSRDDTAAVVGEFGPAVHYLWQENRGVSAARNRGAAASTGDLIAFLDSDDLWAAEQGVRASRLFRDAPGHAGMPHGTRYGYAAACG